MDPIQTKSRATTTNNLNTNERMANHCEGSDLGFRERFDDIEVWAQLSSCNALFLNI